LSDRPVTVFPSVEGRSLDGRTVWLPGDLEGELNLLAVAFHRRHQKDVDSWSAEFRSLESRYESLAAYEIPTISGRWKPARRFIDGGMSAAIPDPRTRARTVTVYGDTSRITDALELPDREQIAVVLGRRDGRVVWLGRGRHSEDPAAGLRAVLAGPPPQGRGLPGGTP
jgi:hypothetical protein